MRITFDDDKRRLTLENRSLDFVDAGQVFAGYHYTDTDDRFDYGEDREITVGLLNGDVIVVVWTERENSRRIISMRKARRDEREQYYQRLDGSG